MGRTNHYVNYVTACCDFFFSSRRRHTRCGRDWSSDVCSSDLSAPGVAEWRAASASMVARSTSLVPADRSEERRVGKDRRSRWPPTHYKTTNYRASLRFHWTDSAPNPMLLDTCV